MRYACQGWSHSLPHGEGIPCHCASCAPFPRDLPSQELGFGTPTVTLAFLPSTSFHLTLTSSHLKKSLLLYLLRIHTTLHQPPCTVPPLRATVPISELSIRETDTAPCDAAVSRFHYLC